MSTKLKVLLLENIHPKAKTELEAAGFEVELLTYSPSKDELIPMLKKYNAVGIRSKTKMTKEVINANPHLLAIGCFCIGTNQVDLDAAQEAGICVFNAPHSNTRSVAELVIAEIIVLARQLGDLNTNTHLGKWSKTATGSKEIRGKTLGIIGYGHIGSQVSVLAEAMGLKVQYYDVTKKLPLGNATAISSLNELLATSDIVTLHVPGLPETENMISKNELSKMKDGAYLINASRGSVIIIDDLVESINQGKIAGCAVDVYPKEPASNDEVFESPLQKLKNVILTPHIGGSTEEAQLSIAGEVSESLRRYLSIGVSSGAVNFPNVDLQVRPNSKRICNIHRNEPGVLGQINGIISQEGSNIEAQYLTTNDKIGYIVMDVQSEHAEDLCQGIKKLGTSIVTRVVY